MWQRLPICAQEPTVAQVSTIVAFVDIGAEIDEGRHQHDARRDIGGAADDRARHGAEAGGAEAVLAPAVELRRHLVPPGRARRAAGMMLHVVQPERQQHRLLQPLVDDPSRRRCFSATRTLPESSSSSAARPRRAPRRASTRRSCRALRRRSRQSTEAGQCRSSNTPGKCARTLAGERRTVNRGQTWSAPWQTSPSTRSSRPTASPVADLPLSASG